MPITCTHCERTIEFSGEPPRFCGYCGKPLAWVPSTAAYDPEAATLPPPIDPDAPTLGPAPGASPAQAEPDLIGHYRLLRVLGGGGMGKVYEAEHVESSRKVALKLIAADFARSRDAVDRFRQEGRLASGLSHPRCVFVIEADEAQGRPYIAMELMPGDTLHDVVQRQGPMPVQRAVASILDVIEGLSEAHRLGIVHRDVKPSNCFVDADGRVKIGDFGLSKSLIADANLTRTGTFLGTPLYASPEQVKGERVDAQSDVYSVAATLYFLLTGRAPFQTGDLAATLARIVSDDPPSVRVHRPDLPPGLDRVLLRGLARQRDKRYRDLEEFRLALLPFTQDQPNVGSVGIRLAAFVLDYLILIGLNLPISMTVAQKVGTTEVLNPGWSGLLMVLATHVVWLLYFGICEGIWGYSLGKWLLRLRVSSLATMEAPGVLRAMLRTLVLIVCLFGLQYVSFGYAILTMPERAEQVDMLRDPHLLISVMIFAYGPLCGVVLGTLLLCSTMRERNGFRMLNEFASGTCVVRLLEREHRSQHVLPSVESQLTATEWTRVGPYEVKGAFHKSASRQVLLGLDRSLERPVLIEMKPAGATQLSPARRDLSRSTRLRWLGRGTEAGWDWNAFVFVPGAPLDRAVSIKKPLDWKQTRSAMDQLCGELISAMEDDTIPASLEVGQVWLQPDGRVVLLDACMTEAAEKSLQNFSQQAALAFVGRAAALALEGEPRSAQKSNGSIRCPLPISARTLLDPLLGVSKPYRSLADLQGWLRYVRSQPAEVTRLRRSAQLLIMSVCALFTGLGMLILLPVVMAMILTMISTLNNVQLERVLQDYERVQAAELVLAGASAIDPVSAFAQAVGLPHDDYLLAEMRKQVSLAEAHISAQRESAGSLTQWYLAIMEPQLALQKRLIQDERWSVDLRDQAPFTIKQSQEFIQEIRTEGVFIALAIALPWPILAVLWAGLFRGGLTHYLMGLALVRRDGRFAGILRCAWRALLVWTPVAACFIGSTVLLLHYWGSWTPQGSPFWMLLLSTGLWYLGTLLLFAWFAIGVCWPRRGPQDVLSGTYLVPR